MSYSDTPEQSAVIGWQGTRLVVGAFAGTGKTTTLRRFAEQNPDERMLYVATTRARRTLVPDPVVLEVLAQPPAEDILSLPDCGEDNDSASDNDGDCTGDDADGETRDVA